MCFVNALKLRDNNARVPFWREKGEGCFLHLLQIFSSVDCFLTWKLCYIRSTSCIDKTVNCLFAFFKVPCAFLQMQPPFRASKSRSSWRMTHLSLGKHRLHAHQSISDPTNTHIQIVLSVCLHRSLIMQVSWISVSCHLSLWRRTTRNRCFTSSHRIPRQL